MDAHNTTLDAHHVTMDTFSQMTNTQREKENAILISEKQDKSDALKETLQGLIIKDDGYYKSDSANANDA